jgi:putative oxidoreductase
VDRGESFRPRSAHDEEKTMNREKAIQLSLLLLRVVCGVMFFQAGALKTFGWFGGIPGSGGAPAPLMTQVGIGGVMEVVGGILIVLGLLTRPVAFILSGEMAVAYWQFHAPGGFWPIVNHGEPAVFYCFFFLFLSAYGAGAYSLDALLRRRRSSGA